MDIVALEPYLSSSHESILSGLACYSKHRWRVLSLKGQHWRWQVAMAPFLLSQQIRSQDVWADRLFCSDYVDLASLLGYLAPDHRFKKIILYFHENQLTYPVLRPESRDFHLVMMHLHSMQLADEIWFNSDWHLEDFHNGLQKFAKTVPKTFRSSVARMWQRKMKVVYPGIFPIETTHHHHATRQIIWNHRLEWDKNPEFLLEIGKQLVEENINFKLHICGSTQHSPRLQHEFEVALGDKVRFWGKIETREEYVNRLQQCDIVISTAIHEFFGVSVLEAIAAGCYPLLPDRLSYRELIPKERHHQHLYSDSNDLLEKLKGLSQLPPSPVSPIAHKFFWPNRIAAWDQLME